MTFLNRLRPYFFLIALALGLALIQVISPLDDFDGWLLILYGVWISGLSDLINPPVAKLADGPPLPWNKMRAGEKLEYLFGAMTMTTIGLLVTIITLLSPDAITEKLWPLGFGLVATAMGTGLGYWNWQRDFKAVESE